jgi:3-oxoacyl-[acyl-carrier protein] reductase
MVEQTEEAFGAVDILVNNTNMAFAIKPVTALSWEEFSSKLNNEMKAAFLLTQAVAPAMIERNSGRLIYISSSAADVAAPYFAAHGSAKGTLNSYVKHVALELGPFGITANVISPSLVETGASRFTPDSIKEQIAQLTPLQRIAQPEDISGTAAFLSSEDARFITGTRTSVSGGFTMM